MRARSILITALSLLLLVGMANAQWLDCSTLYTAPPTDCIPTLLPGCLLSSGTAIFNPNVLYSYSILIVLTVLTVIGVVYAIGYAFGLQRLITYSRTEILESVFNIILIVVLVGGSGVLDGSIAFISNIALSGIQSYSGIQNAPVTNALGTYEGICSNYQSDIGGLISSAIGLSVQNVLLQTLNSVNIQANPNDGGLIPYTPGFAFSPFNGLAPLIQVVNIETAITMGIAVLEIGVVMLTYFIYFLFPIFLYLGIAFRSFPWTRAAGGAMLGLFIAFWIIFPGIMYPFSYNTITTPSCGSNSATGNVCPNQQNLGDVASGVTGSVFGALSYLSLDFGYMYINIVDGFVAAITSPILKLFGVVIAFMISFDLLEILGDLLGAPSLQGRKLMQKMI